jgi:glycine oxidase
MLVLRDPHPAPLTAVVRSEDVYVVPRLDGTLIIGSTAERGRTTLETDDATLGRLHAVAAALLPALRHAERLDAWAGIRPGTPDGLPILAKLGPRIYAATGHFRNGLLLAPATARLMAQLIGGHPHEIDLEPFRGTRFANSHAPKL